MVKDYSRQEGLFNPPRHKVGITVIGAGSVGSFTTLCLAKMGFDDITVYDADLIEVHNLPNQFYRMADLNHFKVIALRNIISEFENINIKTVNQFFNPTEHQITTPIIISAVDSIAARRRIVQAIDPAIHTYIDSRMGGELMRVYSINSTERMTEYLTTLREPTEEIRCTMRTILYNVLTIAGIITSLVRKSAVNQSIPYEVIFDIGSYTAIRTD
jgi:molybdopterin/thiamine biosynthesis adenylyltransferase